MAKAIVKDGAALLTIQISSYILPLITLPYLTRILGKKSLVDILGEEWRVGRLQL